jgi:hypothetical protein
MVAGGRGMYVGVARDVWEAVCFEESRDFRAWITDWIDGEYVES